MALNLNAEPVLDPLNATRWQSESSVCETQGVTLSIQITQLAQAQTKQKQPLWSFFSSSHCFGNKVYMLERVKTVVYLFNVIWLTF